MIKKQIDNKQEFQIYTSIKLIITTVGVVTGVLSILSMITHDWSYIKFIVQYIGLTAMFIILGGLVFIFIVFGLFEYLLKPSYIEAIFSESEIIIKTFKPNSRNVLGLIQILRYKNYLQVWKLSRQQYIDYKLLIEKLGFKKILQLQKIDKRGIYETSEINISLLVQRKYSNLILSIDRLKGKINLN